MGNFKNYPTFLQKTEIFKNFTEKFKISNKNRNFCKF